MTGIFEIFNDIQNSDGILNFTPITQFYIALIIFVVITFIFFTIDKSLYSKTFQSGYVWFYILVFFNMINIMFVLYYSDTKLNNGFIGPEGIIGHTGKKGKYGRTDVCISSELIDTDEWEELEGKDMSCMGSLDIYSVTPEYRPLREIKIKGNDLFNPESNDLLNNNIPNLEFFLNYDLNRYLVDEISTEKSYIGVNYNNIINSVTELYNNTNNTNNDYMFNIFKAVVSDLNESSNSMKDDRLIFTTFDESSNQSKLSDTVYNPKENYDLTDFNYNSFTISKDMDNNNDRPYIDIPVNNIGENGPQIMNVDSFALFKINDDTSRNNYKGLGYCLFTRDRMISNKLSHYKLVRKDCVNLMKVRDLELVGFYYGSVHENNINPEIYGRFSDIGATGLNFNIRGNNEVTIFSIWRTPMNTMYIRKSSESRGFISGSLAYNILFENDTSQDEIKNSRYLNEEGDVKSYYLNKIKNTLKKYKFSDKVVAFFINTFICLNIYENLKYQEEEVYKIDFNNQECVADFGTDIGEKKCCGMRGNINENDKRENKICSREKPNCYIRPTTSASSGTGSSTITEDRREPVCINQDLMIRKNIIDYRDKNEVINKVLPTSLIKSYINRIKSIPGLINSVDNLYDLLLILFPRGLTYLFVDTKSINRGNDKLYTGHSFNPIQKLFLHIVRTIFPPTHDIYVLNDSCSRSVDINDMKNSLITSTLVIMREADNLYNYYKLINQKEENKEELSDKEEERKCENFERIDISRNLLMSRLKITLDHYPNYKENLKKYNLVKFSEGRINTIKKLYSEYLNVIKENCKSI